VGHTLPTALSEPADSAEAVGRTAFISGQSRVLLNAAIIALASGVIVLVAIGRNDLRQIVRARLRRPYWPVRFLSPLEHIVLRILRVIYNGPGPI